MNLRGECHLRGRWRAQKRDDAFRGRWEPKGLVRIRGKHLTWSWRLRPPLEGRFGDSRCGEDDVAAREEGAHVGKASRFERPLQIGHLRVHRHDAAEKSHSGWWGILLPVSADRDGSGDRSGCGQCVGAGSSHHRLRRWRGRRAGNRDTGHDERHSNGAGRSARGKERSGRPAGEQRTGSRRWGGDSGCRNEVAGASGPRSDGARFT